MFSRRSFLKFCGLASGGALWSGCGQMEVEARPWGGGGGRVILGIDRLAASGFAGLRGKRVGLILNQTSVAGGGTPSRVILRRALGRQFTALYTPEHGLDGREVAGRQVSSRRDPLTGLPAYSLYGDTRKPTPEMLAGVDVLLFDLQDIGSRSYTYLSTMALAMEACAEQGKAFMVLDRPNPLGGLRVSGPPLAPQWKSFVGQFPVPYVHGLTAGELARMIAARGWIKASPELAVVPLAGWSRSMVWGDTGLRWIPTSPNIPRSESPFYYAATGILGGLDGVDIGIGSGRPFEYAGGRGLDGRELADSLERRRLPGVRFRPYQSVVKPGFGGAQLQIDPHGGTDLLGLAVLLAAEVCRRTGGAPLRATRGDTRNLFHKVYGSDSLFGDLQQGRPVGSIVASWQSSLGVFRRERQGHLLYS